MKKKRLTVLIGAGAVVEVSNVTTSSITTQLLNSNEISNNSKRLFTKIFTDLKNNNKNWQDYTPNFEEIFHALEILTGLYVQENSAPEFKPMYKYFTTLKKDYELFNPYIYKGNITLSLAFSDLLKVIIGSIESYSTQNVAEWYKDFFLELNKHYELDIFSLNYDNWFEKIFKNYNDGFEGSKDNGEFIEFDSSKAINLDKYSVNINHLHGQIDFSFINNLEIAKKDFDDDNFYTIYKIKNNSNNNLKRISEGNYENIQNGELLKLTTIITGKNKAEKVSLAPFDAYRANLQNCIIQNPNLLIIGYGFADYYINNILKQFNKMHQNKKRVNIIDFADELNWNNKISTREQISETKFRTLYGIFNDKNVEEMLNNSFVPSIPFNNSLNHLYLGGFKNTAKHHIKDIINTYKD